MLYKGNPLIHGWMKYVVIVGMSTNFQLCKLTSFQIVFNYNSNFEFPANTLFDTPPDSWMDSTASPKVKIAEGEGIGAHSLARSILGVEGCVEAPR